MQMSKYPLVRATICQVGSSPRKHFGKFRRQWKATDWLESHGWKIVGDPAGRQYGLEGSDMRVYVTEIRGNAHTEHLSHLPRTPRQ